MPGSPIVYQLTVPGRDRRVWKGAGRVASYDSGEKMTDPCQYQTAGSPGKKPSTGTQDGALDTTTAISTEG